MALGAYSIVRYSNSLSDQRINLGVAVWHPTEGMLFRVASGLDRIHAIDPTTPLTPIRAQLKSIESELSGETASAETLVSLAHWFRNGIEVSEPYPARMQSAEETAQALFAQLVSPNPFIRSSSQRQFERHFKKILESIARRSGAIVEDLGSRRIGDVTVSLGIRTQFEERGRLVRPSLWKPLSLQSHDAARTQIAFAKETAQDIAVIREMPDFRRQPIYVPVKPPKPSAAAGLDESLAWLRRSGAHPFVDDSAAMNVVLRDTFHGAFQTA